MKKKNYKTRTIMLFVGLFCLAALSQARTQSGTSKSTPVLTILGEDTVYIDIDLNGQYNETGYRALDSMDGDISTAVRVSGTVNTSKRGVYILTYMVNNACGRSDTAYRTIIVGDFTAPTIQARNSNTVYTHIHEPFYVQNHLIIYDKSTDSSFLYDSLKVVYNDVDTSKTGTYKVIVRAIDSSYNLSDSFTLQVVVRDTTTAGLNLELLSKSHHLLYPNPGNGEIYFRSDKPLKKIAIYNRVGELVYDYAPTSANNQTLTLHVSHLPPGLYVCTGVMTDNTKWTQKLFLRQ